MCTNIIYAKHIIKSVSKRYLAPTLLLVFLMVLAALVIPTASSDAGMGSESADSRATRADAKWTFMVYMAADNDLEPEAINDLNEMELIGSTDDVNILVQIDRIYGYVSPDPDWTLTRRYRVTKDSNTAVIFTIFFRETAPVSKTVSIELVTSLASMVLAI